MGLHPRSASLTVNGRKDLAGGTPPSEWWLRQTQAQSIPNFCTRNLYQIWNLARQSGTIWHMARTRLSICQKPGCTGSSTCKECRAIYRRMKRAGPQAVTEPVPGPAPAPVPGPPPAPPPVAKTAKEILRAIPPRSGDPIGDWNRWEPPLEGYLCAAQIRGVQCGKTAVKWRGRFSYCEEHGP